MTQSIIRRNIVKSSLTIFFSLRDHHSKIENPQLEILKPRQELVSIHTSCPMLAMSKKSRTPGIEVTGKEMIYRNAIVLRQTYLQIFC